MKKKLYHKSLHYKNVGSQDRRQIYYMTMYHSLILSLDDKDGLNDFEFAYYFYLYYFNIYDPKKV